MSESENVALVRRLMEAFERSDTKAQLGLLDPEVEIVEWPEGPDQRTYRGHDGAVQARESWSEAWEWVRTDVDEFVEVANKVLLCGRAHAKGMGSSVEVVMDAFNVYTVGGGKVARVELFTTREPALRAAGLEKSSRSEEAA